MEYYRRFASFLSKLNCNNTKCVNTKKGFQKCNDVSNQERTNDADLNKSVHIENDLLELIEPTEPFETNELMVSTDINVDDFDEYHNHEIIDSYDNFSNVVVQPVD